MTHAKPDPTEPTARGVLLIVSSPSGAGKTTLCRRLVAEFPALGFSISYTTRKPRTGEQDGRDYCFVDDATFDQMIATEEFAEWATVHGNRYGTTRATVDEALSHCRDLIFDIDWQGALQLRARFAAEAVLVFVLPPSMAELERRLRGRKTDDEPTIARRLAQATVEIRKCTEYDFLLPNCELEAAYAGLRGIYVAAHFRRVRMERAVQALLSA